MQRALRGHQPVGSSRQPREGGHAPLLVPQAEELQLGAPQRLGGSLAEAELGLRAWPPARVPRRRLPLATEPNEVKRKGAQVQCVDPRRGQGPQGQRLWWAVPVLSLWNLFSIELQKGEKQL